MAERPYRERLDVEGLPRAVRCPFCGGSETELHSAFGNFLSISQYYCRRCRTVFDWVKWDGEAAPAPEADGPED